MFTLESATNPIYVSEDKQAINLIVKWAEFTEPHSFTASSNDSEAHGLELFALAKSGKFGIIADYISPTTEELEAVVKEKAKALLFASDWSVLPDIVLNNQAAFIEYRAALRGLMINPVADAEFPSEPQPVWNV